jgi:hypothetical protein
MKSRWFAGGTVLALPTAALMLLAAPGGCSSHPTAVATMEASPIAEDAGAAAATDDAVATVQLTWVVNLTANPGTGLGDGSTGPVASSDGGLQLQPIEGVKVCAMGHAEIACVMTASDGTFTISGLPPGGNVALTFDKPGYKSLIKPIEMGRTDEESPVPVLMSRTSDLEPHLGFPIDLQTQGAIQFFVLSFAGAIPDSGGTTLLGFTSVPGVKMSLMPASGNGPYFVDNYNQVAVDAGGMVGFNALYYNVAPGDYSISVDDPKDYCAAISFTFASSGYPDLSVPHGVVFPVVAGYTDAVGVLCTRNARLVPVDGG